MYDLHRAMIDVSVDVQVFHSYRVDIRGGYKGAAFGGMQGDQSVACAQFQKRTLFKYLAGYISQKQFGAKEKTGMKDFRRNDKPDAPITVCPDRRQVFGQQWPVEFADKIFYDCSHVKKYIIMRCYVMMIGYVVMICNAVKHSYVMARSRGLLKRAMTALTVSAIE